MRNSSLLWRSLLRAPASEMPYGVVMATGGAGGVAGLVGLHAITAALTAIALVQALLVPAHAMLAQGGVRAPRWRFGLFTIPLGLAVIGGNLQPLFSAAGDIALGLAWLTTLVLGCWRIGLAFLPEGREEVVDGTWFLAPAALLGDAFAMAGAVSAHMEWKSVLILAACLSGVAGYALVLAASGWRLLHHGLAGSPLAPWWISAGCGGLAAAAAGAVARRVSESTIHAVLNGLVVTTWVVGTVLLVAVLVGCARYAWCRPHGPWAHVWTPVFSMAVYTDGTARLAWLSGARLLVECTFVAVAVTLALWTINSALYLRNAKGPSAP